MHLEDVHNGDGILEELGENLEGLKGNEAGLRASKRNSKLNTMSNSKRVTRRNSRRLQRAGGSSCSCLSLASMRNLCK